MTKVFDFADRKNQLEVANFLAQTLPTDEQKEFSVVYGGEHANKPYSVTTFSNFVANEVNLYCIFHEIPYKSLKEVV